MNISGCWKVFPLGQVQSIVILVNMLLMVNGENWLILVNMIEEND